MADRGAAAFRPFYDIARAAWPILPVDVVILDYPTPNGAECKGVVNGRLTFWIDPNYWITDIIAFHECGHGVEAMLEYRGVSKDRTRTALWQRMGYPGTWQERDAYARTLSGEAQWDNLPVEIVAETWRCGHMGPPSAERTVYLGPTDHAAYRSIYEDLCAEAGMATVDFPGAIWVRSPNYTLGRSLGAPLYIILHWTVGTAPSAIARFQDPSSNVSSHYLVDREARVYQFVRESNAAWHAVGWNERSIGIEFEDFSLDITDWTPVQIQKGSDLLVNIATRWNIPLERIYVFGHGEVNATRCPGDLPIEKLIGGDGMAADPEVLSLLKEIAKNTKDTYDKVNALGIGIPIWEDRASGGRDVMTGGPKPGIEP